MPLDLITEFIHIELHAESDKLYQPIMRALSQSEEAGIDDALIELLTHENARLREHVAIVLIDRDVDYSVFANLLQHNDMEIRVLCTMALGLLQNPLAIDVLREMREGEKLNKYLLLACKYAMFFLGAKDDFPDIQETIIEQAEVGLPLFDDVGEPKLNMLLLTRHSWRFAVEGLVYWANPKTVEVIEMSYISRMEHERMDMKTQNILRRSGKLSIPTILWYLDKISDETFYDISHILSNAMSPEALAPLISMSGRLSANESSTIDDMISDFGERAVLPLIDALYFPDLYPAKESWSTMPYLLGKLKDKRAVWPLVWALQNVDDTLMQEACTLALGEIGDRRASEVLLRELAQQMSDGTLFKRSRVQSKRRPYPVIWALGELGETRAIEPLRQAIEPLAIDANRVEIGSILEALAKLGDEVFVIEYTERLLTHRTDDLSQNSPDFNRLILVLKHFEDSERAAKLLLRYMDAVEWDYGTLSTATTVSMGIQHQILVDLLVKIVNVLKTIEIRKWDAERALKVLGSMQLPEATDALLRYLDEVSREDMPLIFRALTKTGDPQIVDRIDSYREDDDPQIRWWATYTIIQLSDELSLETIEQVLKEYDDQLPTLISLLSKYPHWHPQDDITEWLEDSNFHKIYRIIRSLSSLGDRAVPNLRKLLNDRRYDPGDHTSMIRDEAYAALRRINTPLAKETLEQAGFDWSQPKVLSLVDYSYLTGSLRTMPDPPTISLVELASQLHRYHPITIEGVFKLIGTSPNVAVIDAVAKNLTNTPRYHTDVIARWLLKVGEPAITSLLAVLDHILENPDLGKGPICWLDFRLENIPTPEVVNFLGKVVRVTPNSVLSSQVRGVLFRLKTPQAQEILKEVSKHNK